MCGGADCAAHRSGRTVLLLLALHEGAVEVQLLDDRLIAELEQVELGFLEPVVARLMDIARTLEAPTAEHLLGTDDLGRESQIELYQAAIG